MIELSTFDGQQLPLRFGDIPPRQTLGDPGEAEIAKLRGEIERLSTERNRLLESQRRMMELMGTTKPEKLLHDLRNVLNEITLLRTLLDHHPA